MFVSLAVPAHASVGSFMGSLWQGVKRHPIATALTSAAALLGAYNLFTYDWKGADKAFAQIKSNKKLLHEFKPHINIQELLVFDGNSWSPISDTREAKLSALTIDEKMRAKLDRLINDDKEAFVKAQKSQETADQEIAHMAREELIQCINDLCKMPETNEASQKLLFQFSMNIQIKKMDHTLLTFGDNSWGAINDSKKEKLVNLKISKEDRTKLNLLICKDQEKFSKAKMSSLFSKEEAFNAREKLLKYIIALFKKETTNDLLEGYKFAYKAPISFCLMLSPLLVCMEYNKIK